MFDKMRMKDKILSELMDEMDSQEGDKLKPKAMGVSITAVKPKDEMDMKDMMEAHSEPDLSEMSSDKPGMPSEMSEHGGNSDEELKELMKEYLSRHM